jgi:hypothetical protein
MTRPLNKSTNLGTDTNNDIEISSKPPIQSIHIDMASSDLKSFDAYINLPSSHPLINSAENKTSSPPQIPLKQNTPRGLA